jgi:hypothetical protein
MKIVGQLETQLYKLTVMMESPPSPFQSFESEWLYISKHDGNGKIGRQSIGIGMSNIDVLIRLLSEASSRYQGKRKEFRVTSSE